MTLFEELSNLDINDMASWTRRVKMVMATLLAIIIIGLGYKFVVQPKLVDLENVEAREPGLKKTYLDKKELAINLEEYKKHCIDQAITVLTAGHDVKCMFGTPKLIESLALALEDRGTSLPEVGITGIFSGGTEFTPQWTRFCIQELFGGPPEESGVYMTPTYGNTLMGLACSRPVSAADNYTIAYYAPQPRAVTEVVEFEDTNQVVGYGETGRVKLTTLTKEFFVPGFLERDEGEREKPFDKYPWDGVSGVRPYHKLQSATTVGVY